ncbi:MAG TPA: bacterial transcriptional activator domain-containing protein [Solirubrobacteraceae bacterium]|nr:bacterial transcriptional activator domain-containing protein [Solirubrobacteraceae bacterium]
MLALACLIVLGLLRPALPHVPSLTGPLTTTEVERFILALAWLLGLALAAAVLVQALRRLTHPRPQVLAGVIPRPTAMSPRRVRDGASARYVLTVAAPAAPAVPVVAASEPVAPAPQAESAGEDDQRAVSIAVLGPLTVDGLAHKVKRAATHELLAYLAFHPSGASRDELTEAIWPGQDPKRTRPRLWQSVSEAKRALGEAWLHHGERYQLDRAKVRVDLDDLDRLLAAAREDGEEPAALENALALWRGEPLEGSDFLWADGERRNLHATLVDLLERVGRARLAHGDARAALQLAEQAIGLEDLHEPSWRLALQAEHALGLRESVRRRYDELTRSLDEQLGLEPARETRLVYRQLLGQT